MRWIFNYVGDSNTVTTPSCFIFGSNNTIGSDYNFVVGNNSTMTSGSYNNLQSNSTTIAGNYNSTFGKGTQNISGDDNISFGPNNITGNRNFVSIGSSTNTATGNQITIINGEGVTVTTSGTTYLGGTVSINGAYTLPKVAGSSGQVLTSNGSGLATWKDETKFNASTADQTASGADTYITGSALTIGGIIKAGTILRWRGTVTKTAAGTATPTFNVRFGTNGTTADTARHTFTGVAQTAATDTGLFEITVVIRSVQATATSHGVLDFRHFNTTTGLANKAQVQLIQNTSATYDNTSASLIAGISINPGASGVWTFQQITAEAINLL